MIPKSAKCLEIHGKVESRRVCANHYKAKLFSHCPPGTKVREKT